MVLTKVLPYAVSIYVMAISLKSIADAFNVFGKPLLNLKDFSQCLCSYLRKSMETSLGLKSFSSYTNKGNELGSFLFCVFKLYKRKGRIFPSFLFYQIFFRIFIMSSLVGTLGFVFVQLSRRAASAIALSLDSYSAYVKPGTASCTVTGIPSSICIERM